MSDMRIAKKFLLPWIALLALCLCAGCRQLVKEAFKTPKVELLDVGIESGAPGKLEGPWRFLVTLAVDNPNPYAIEVARLAWTGMIGDAVVTEGSRDESIRIEASRRTTVRVPVAIRPGAFEAAARQVLARKSLSWELNGSVGLRAPLVGVVPVPFSKSGSYDLFYILKRMGIGLN